jgi:nitrile hydratase accessory protein
LSRPDPADLGPLPRGPDGEPVFRAPWEARAFALTVALHEQGLFTWGEWAAALGKSLAGGKPDGSDYYERWVEALESLLPLPEGEGRGKVLDAAP